MSKKICFIVTVAMTVDQFIRFSFEAFRKDGFEIYVIADMDEEYISTLPEYVHPLSIKMGRGIHPRDFFKVTKEMRRIFKREKFDIVQYSTPNASCYAAIAARRARVPVRLYCQWGLVYQGFKGIKRFVFKMLERFVCALSTDVQPDSKGNLDLCRKMHFYSEKKSRVVWNGSANGISLSKFRIEKKSEFNKQIREKHGIPMDATVVGYVGRVGREKGFEELVEMTRALTERYDNLVLLYVGPNEKPDTVSPEALDYFFGCDRVIYTGGWVDDTERYYAAMDVFVFPTYHEGFGSVAIEAEVMGVPVVVSDVPGPQNAIIDGVTGYKVPPRDAAALVEKVSYLIDNPSLREEMGVAAHEFVRENFDDRILLEKIIENRNSLLQRKKKNTKKE